ncbi:MAG: hypothetical protein Q7N87_05015 [Candidatus Uhrbacteria bacterium]|nr:hypothetical protein [Candidatus Uhrbacteria bacterium]
MVGVLFWMYVIACIFCLVGVFLAVDEKLIRNRIIGGLMMVIPIGFMLSPLYVEYALRNESTHVVSFNGDGKIEHVSRWAVFCWNKCFSVQRSGIVAKATVQLITDNPKARRLSYQVEFEVTDFQRLLSSGEIPRTLPIGDEEVNKTSILRLVRYHLYEFNNTFSKELGSIYNPLDPAQHQRLQAMLRDYLAQTDLDRYGGIRMTRLVSFEVE